MHTIESQLSLATHVRSQTGSRRLVLALGVLLFSLTACAKDRTATDTSAAAERRAGSTDTASLSGMKGMSGDSGGMGAMKGMSGMMSMMGAMPAHHTRMVRLMDMHQAMTKNMKM